MPRHWPDQLLILGHWDPSLAPRFRRRCAANTCLRPCLWPHKQDRPAGLGDIAHFSRHLLELRIPTANTSSISSFRVQVGSPEGQPHAHPRRIARLAGVSGNRDAGEFNDLCKFAVNLRFAHAQDGPIEVDVLPAGEFRVKSRCPPLAGHPATNACLAAGWFRNLRQYLQQCALASSVTPHNAHHFALLHGKIHILQRPHTTSGEIRCRTRPKGGADSQVAGRLFAAQAITVPVSVSCRASTIPMRYRLDRSSTMITVSL